MFNRLKRWEMMVAAADMNTPRPIPETSSLTVEQRAVAQLNRLLFVQAVAVLLRAGFSQENINIFLSHVDHTDSLYTTAERTDPYDETVEEIILKAVVNHTDRQYLIDRLGDYLHTHTRYVLDNTDGTIHSAYGSMRNAVMNGYLTREEYDQICAAVAVDEI